MDLGKLALIGALGVGGILVARELSKHIGVPTNIAVPNRQTTTPDRQVVSTRGNSIAYQPRQSLYTGVGGSIKEIQSLPENHNRGEAINPWWRNWEGYHGSIKDKPSGTFNGVDIDVAIPEMEHSSPTLEATLSKFVTHRVWQTSGAEPVTGTFG